MKSPISVICALALVSGPALAQPRVSVLTLPAASAKSSETLRLVLGVRQLPDGRVLVNDGGRRQVRLFDANLSRSTVVLDSVMGGASSYGPRATPLIAYLGDSSLFADIVSQTMLVLDGNGRVARAMSLPTGSDILAFSGTGTAGADAKGRLVYRSPFAPRVMGSQAPPPSDSLPLVRADLDARRVDTVGRVSQPSGTKTSMTQQSDGKMGMKMVINPLPTVDEWALLADGSVAIVRGHDYHVDWIGPDGAVRSTPKMPFDWRKLTDDDKQKLVDSARTAQDIADAKAAEFAKNPSAPVAPGNAAAASAEMAMMAVAQRSAGAAAGPPMTINMNAKPVIEYMPLKDIADYYPPIRRGATKADLDGNLWILPTTSAQSTGGELVYDVVNTKGELFERVRLPAGRSIVGFGKGGIVYLVSFDSANSFYLERTTLVGAVKSAQ